MPNNWLLIPAALFAWGIWKLYRQEGFFVPLPMKAVRAMLQLADVNSKDVVYDLGSGDGRIVIESVNAYDAKQAVGIEIGTLTNFLAKIRMKWKRADRKRVRLIKNDVFKEDISEATVVTFYLTPKLTKMLKSKLEKELRKGTRVVSAAHEVPGWTAVRKIKTGHFWTYLYKI